MGAPRAFNVKLKRVLGKNVGVLNSFLDDPLTVCHKNGKLIGLTTARVGGLNIVGAKAWVDSRLLELDKVFGGLKLS